MLMVSVDSVLPAVAPPTTDSAKKNSIIKSEPFFDMIDFFTAISREHPITYSLMALFGWPGSGTGSLLIT